ncbi:putative reverse transcriptase domain-containing protein [Tanacetum coccineum]
MNSLTLLMYTLVLSMSFLRTIATPPDTYSFQGPLGFDRLVSRAKTDTTVIPTETPIIAPTIPPSPDYTPASPDYSPASDSESDPSEDPSSDHIPPLPATSPFLSSDDDTTDSDTPDTPPSPTHGTPFTEITSSTQRSPVIPRRRVMILAPGQPIPHGRPYRYHLNEPKHYLLTRVDLIPSPKRIRSHESETDLEGCLEDSFEPYVPREMIDGMDIDQELEESEDVVREARMRSELRGIRSNGHRIIGVESTVTALTERVAELERDDMRLKGTASVESQRVDQLQRGMSRMQRELRQIRWKMPNTRSGASMTHEEVEELVTRRVAEEMEAREAARTLEPLNENGDEQEGENGGNGNDGNGGNRNGGNRNRGNGENENGNRNRNHGMNYGGFMPVARECTFQDFLKCKPHNFSGTEGVAGLMRLMTEVYCPRNEIQKMETELWNLTVKENDLTAYTQRFQELILLCTRMVPDEEDRVERFIGGLPDNIQGNVIATNPARLQDAIRIANQLMDKKLQGYAARSAENKRRMESNPRDNRGQQPLFKRRNVSGQNVARAYAARNNENRGYAGPHPLCNKCRYHHVGPYTVKCNNCKRVRHQMRDCRSAAAVPNSQRALLRNQQGVICYECGRPRPVKRECPKLRNQNHGSRVRNKTGNHTRGNEATTKA